MNPAGPSTGDGHDYRGETSRWHWLRVVDEYVMLARLVKELNIKAE